MQDRRPVVEILAFDIVEGIATHNKQGHNPDHCPTRPPPPVHVPTLDDMDGPEHTKYPNRDERKGGVKLQPQFFKGIILKTEGAFGLHKIT